MQLLTEEARRWTVMDAAELYEVANWGKGYFSVSEQGHICVHPTKDSQRAIDLKQLVDRLRIRGIQPPVLVRFGGILQHRLGELQAASKQARSEEHNYKAGYHCVYPIKVNQQRQIVEEVLQFGSPYQFGLEAGSKPELLAVIAIASNDVPIVCNGFKDEQFVEMALLAQKIGRKIFLVVEKYTDVELILRCAARIDVRPNIGVRVKLASRGSGRWRSSSGHRAKFGLFVSEILRVLADLKARSMEDCLKLLHFHIGSQVTNIRFIKAALNEAARIYVDLVRQGAGLAYMDVGGGLGVDYYGSQTNFESSSVNYTLQEYANDVVFHLQSVCDDASVPHPIIFSESGRAVVAYNSVLVFNVLGVSDLTENGVVQSLPDDAEQPLVDLMDTYQRLNGRNMLECYHDAQQALDTVMSLFNTGYLSLAQRSLAENIFWCICQKVHRLSRQLDIVPEEFEGLEAMLSETYFCNFSLFQSLPDSWAIKQLFPIMPIHRLDQRPSHAAILGDITCDSDGKIERFIDRRNIKHTLPLHSLDSHPYYLGAFLIGAYQEILGDMHNLFGDTNAVHVSMGTGDDVIVETMINGDSVREVLEYVEFDTPELVDCLRTAVDQAIRDNRIDDHQGGWLLRSYQTGLDAYTYLEDAHDLRVPPQAQCNADVIRDNS
jgi:arginine decarboxylase